MKKEEIRPKDWMDREATVTLTGREWSLLEDYLLLSAEYREGNAGYYEERSGQTNQYDRLEIKNFTERAEFWKRMCREIPKIRQRILEAQ